MHASAHVAFLLGRCGQSEIDSQTSRYHCMTSTSLVQQHEQRIANHHHSEKAKAPITKNLPAEHITVGELVYVYSDRNKTRAHHRYLVIEVTGSFCNIRMFVGSQL